MLRPLPLALLALGLTASPAAAGWSPAHLQSRSGQSYGVTAAGGSGDRIAIGWQRDLKGAQRAELRLGRARDGLTAKPLLLDHNARHAVEPPLPEYVSGGAFAAVWRRLDGKNHRLRLRTVNRDGRLGATTRLTGDGESAYYPRWTDGPGTALHWSRRTRTEGAVLDGDGLRRLDLPAAPVSGFSAASGLATVSWAQDRAVRVSDRNGGAFTPTQTLARGSVVFTHAVRVQGATLVLWTQDHDLMVAARAADGEPFGVPRKALSSLVGDAAVKATSTGDVLVVAPTGDSSKRADLQLLRLGTDGAPLAPARSLGRGRFPLLAADGTGSAFVASTGLGGRRRVTVRRIAEGGTLGRPMRLASGLDSPIFSALAATREGGAVLAWVERGQVHARTYRP